MTTNIKTLDTTNWQHARGTIGDVVTEIKDIEQCLETISNCKKGKVAHNPNLGLDLMNYLDKPLNEVSPILKTVLKIEYEYQEPRIKVDSISFQASQDGYLIIKITYIHEKTIKTKEIETQWQII